MKYIKSVLTVLSMFVLCTAFSAKKDDPKIVYAFGLSASFTDTIVCYTDIQILDSVKLTKTDFLPNRDLYSYQLKNFVEGVGYQKTSTSMIYFSDKKSKLEKERESLLNKYRKNKGLTLKLIESKEFRFVKPDIE